MAELHIQHTPEWQMITFCSVYLTDRQSCKQGNKLSRFIMPCGLKKSRRQNRSQCYECEKDPSEEGINIYFTIKQHCNHRYYNDCVNDPWGDRSDT